MIYHLKNTKIWTDITFTTPAAFWLRRHEPKISDRGLGKGDARPDINLKIPGKNPNKIPGRNRKEFRGMLAQMSTWLNKDDLLSQLTSLLRELNFLSPLTRPVVVLTTNSWEKEQFFGLIFTSNLSGITYINIFSHAILLKI